MKTKNLFPHLIEIEFTKQPAVVEMKNQCPECGALDISKDEIQICERCEFKFHRPCAPLEPTLTYLDGNN